MFARGLFFYSATITDHCSRTGHARPSGRSDNTAKGAGNALPTVFDGNANGRGISCGKRLEGCSRAFRGRQSHMMPNGAEEPPTFGQLSKAPWESPGEGWPSIPFSSSYACASGKDKNEKHRPRLGVRRKRGGLTVQAGQRADHAPRRMASGLTV